MSEFYNHVMGVAVAGFLLSLGGRFIIGAVRRVVG